MNASACLNYGELRTLIYVFIFFDSIGNMQSFNSKRVKDQSWLDITGIAPKAFTLLLCDLDALHTISSIQVTELCRTAR